MEAPNQPTTKKNIMLCRKTFYLVFSDKVHYKSGFSIILKLGSLSCKTLLYYVEIFLKCSVLSCCLKGIKKKVTAFSGSLRVLSINNTQQPCWSSGPQAPPLQDLGCRRNKTDAGHVKFWETTYNPIPSYLFKKVY